MEEELSNFLHKRGVAEAVIRKMSEHKIDKYVIEAADDTILMEYLPVLGDRVAIKEFCKTTNMTPSMDKNKKKDGIMKALRRKLQLKRRSLNVEKTSSESDENDSAWSQSTKKRNHRHGNQSAKRDTRKIEIGWLHFDSTTKRFRQMRSKQGGGTRQIAISKTANLDEVTKLAKQLFFPGGNSPCGKAEDFWFEIRDFSQEVYTSKETVGELYDRTGLNTLRYYLASKGIDQISSEEPNPVSTYCRQPPLANTSEFSNDDSLPLSFENEVFFNFKTDLTSATNSQPKTQNTVTLSNTTEEDNTSLTNTTSIVSALPCLDHGDILIPTSTQEEVILLDSAPQESISSRTNLYDLNIPLLVDMTDEGSPFRMPLNDTEVRQSGYEITIHRGPLAFHEMLSYFKDPSIVHKILTVVRILPNGEREQGEDTGGVLRDLLSEFWTDFNSRCTVGRNTKVPCLRHDFGTEEWKAVARVLYYGWENAGYWPVQLSFAFMHHCLSGELPETDKLLADYFEFIAIQDRQVFEIAIDNYQNVDNEELLEALDSHDCRTAVRAETIKAVLLEMAHKEIIQMPVYVADCWQEVFSHHKVAAQLTDIYSSLTVTNKKVVNLLHFPSMTSLSSLSEGEVTKNLKKYVRELDPSKLGLFLRYCTGSNLITVPQIKVEYCPMSGASRRPIAHTCGCLLMLPNKYDNFMEFRSDFDSVLESNVWIMDIV